MNMTTQTINEATYNAFTLVPVAIRTTEMQEQIEAYEAENKLNVDDENLTTNAPVVAQDAVEPTQLNDDMPVKEEVLEEQSEPSEVSTQTAEEVALSKLEAIQADQKTAEVLASFNTQFERFSPRLKNDALQNLVALSQLANGFSKQNSHHLVLTCYDLAVAEKLVKIRSYLDFDCVVSDREDSYAIQGDLFKAPYATHGIYLDSAISSSKPFKHHPEAKEIKHGSKFIACVGAKPYDHAKNDLVVAYVDKAVEFVDEVAGEDITAINDKTDLPMMMHKIARQQWRDELGEQIKTYINSPELAEITKQLRPTSANAWKPFLVIAKMVSDDLFKAMYQLMTEYAATASLDDKYTVYAAVQLALPEYEQYVSKYGFAQAVSSKTIEGWVKYYGQSVMPKKVNEALNVKDRIEATSNKFCLGINTSGFELSKLKAFVDAELDMNDQRLIKLVAKMKEAPTKNVEALAA